MVEDVLEVVVMEAESESQSETEAGFVRVVDEDGVGGMVDDGVWWVADRRCCCCFILFLSNICRCVGTQAWKGTGESGSLLEVPYARLHVWICIC